nr:MAG TPA: tail connector protein [Caudoviricetes sp.]
MLVAHWYENRTIYSAKPGAINDIPHSVTALLIHIAQCGAYTGDAND